MRLSFALSGLCIALWANAAHIPLSVNQHAPRTIYQLPQLLSCLGTLTLDIITNLSNPSKLKPQTIACLCQAAVSTDGTLDFLLIGRLLGSLGLPTKEQDLETLLRIKCKVSSYASQIER